MSKALFLCFVLLLTEPLGLLAQNTPAPIKLISFVIGPDAKDWNYRVGQKASARVTVLKYGIPVENVKISYEVGPEMLKPDNTGSIELKDGTGTIDVGTSSTPGFRQLVIKAVYDGHTYSDQVKVGFSPAEIKPTVEQPKDFKTFWEEAKAAAAKIPMDAIVTPLPQYATGSVDVFLINLQNARKGRRLYGYLCKPKAPGKYPVMMVPPGAGVKKMSPYTAYAERGYISLSIEIHGVSPELDTSIYRNLSAAIGDYPSIGMDDRSAYYYRNVYLGCVRSIDYLCSLPEWDGKNVIVTGGSQGGALTIVTAGLDRRVTALAAFYPALSDMTGYLHGRAGGWPQLLNDNNKALNNKPEKINTLSYYDVVNFAREIQVPGFYSCGYNDNTCPPTSVLSAFNVVKSPKVIVTTPISGHWRFGETDEKAMAWLKEHLIK